MKLLGSSSFSAGRNRRALPPPSTAVGLRRARATGGDGKTRSSPSSRPPALGDGTAVQEPSRVPPAGWHLNQARVPVSPPLQDGPAQNAEIQRRIRKIPQTLRYNGKGLGWTAMQLNRLVGSFDEAAMAEWLDRWTREPDFLYPGTLSAGGFVLLASSSPRFDVFGNDFGWGKPTAVRSGPGNKLDEKATVFEGPGQGGSMSLEVCVTPDVLERLLADEEFMNAVSIPM